ncbi:MAG: hypothetical protein KAI66_05905 [Lentisphaeria bacterium]|nr:hypothetical protein [Lentisphaeria bacterium]
MMKTVTILAAFLIAPTLVRGADTKDAFVSLAKYIREKPGIAAKDGALRKLAIESIARCEAQEAIGIYAGFLMKTLNGKKKGKLPKERVSVMLKATDAAMLLSYYEFSAKCAPWKREATEWLFSSNQHLRLFLDTLTPYDDWGAAYHIIEQLHEHDPKHRDEYRSLIMALAVVWDQPRPPLHGQMGGNQLPYKTDIIGRYDYFRDLFASRKAEIAYRKLSVSALTMIVDTPVPLAELEWVREHVKPRSWSKKFSEIRYATGRLERRVYQWPGGVYALATIKSSGGICVDQAYYAVLCSRAWGVPALIFVGEGRRGPHAWFGYMKGTTNWEMDIGRYTYDKYASGRALNPQTNQDMSDHYLQFLCDRSLSASRYRKASSLARLAHVLRRTECFTAAKQAAQASIDVAPLYERSWTILAEIYQQQGKKRSLLDLLEKQAVAFRKYDDYVVDIHNRQATLLRELGETDKADRIVRRSQSRMSRKRDDLTRFLASEQIERHYKAGKYTLARKEMEKLLKKQKNEGQKVVQLVDSYLTLTKEMGQEKDAARFMRRYSDSMRRAFDKSDHNERIILNFLLRAYENAEDEKNSARTRKKIGKLH